MKKEYFVQYSHQSIIKSFDFPKDNFVSITIGMTEITYDFIISLVQKMQVGGLSFHRTAQRTMEQISLIKVTFATLSTDGQVEDLPVYIEGKNQLFNSS